MRPLAFVGLAIAIAACGLSVTGAEDGTATLPGDEAGVGAPDSTSGGPGPTADGQVPIGEASSDAPIVVGKPDAAGCTTVVDDDFSTQKAEWKLAQSARFVTGSMVLTTKDVDSDRGGIWWSVPTSFTGSLRATVDYVVDPGTQPGVGLALAWVKSNASFTIGDQGLNYGICTSGLTGVAAALRMQSQQTVYGIAGVSGVCDTIGGVQGSAGSSGRFVMTVTSTSVTATLPGSTGDTTQTRSSLSVSTTGLFGITASTGTGSAGQSAFSVTAVKVERCP